MRKMAKLFLAFILVVGLTGRVKYNVSMEVKNDKSVTLEIIYGMEVSNDFVEGNVEEDAVDNDSTTLEEDDGEDNTEVSIDDYAYLEALGYKVEEYKDKTEDVTISGVKISKTFNNIDSITSKEKITVDFNLLFDEENVDKLKDSKFFYKDGDKYVADFVFDFLEGADEETRKESESFDVAITDLSYTIKLPTEGKEHNATKVSADGKELTWKLVYSKFNKVNYAFAFAKEPVKNNVVAFSVDLDDSNTLVILGAVVCGFIVVGLVVAIIIIQVKREKAPKVVIQKVVSQPINNVQPVVESQPVIETQSVVEEQTTDGQNNSI